MVDFEKIITVDKQKQISNISSAIKNISLDIKDVLNSKNEEKIISYLEENVENIIEKLTIEINDKGLNYKINNLSTDLLIKKEVLVFNFILSPLLASIFLMKDPKKKNLYEIAAYQWFEKNVKILNGVSKKLASGVKILLEW